MDSFHDFCVRNCALESRTRDLKLDLDFPRVVVLHTGVVKSRGLRNELHSIYPPAASPLASRSHCRYERQYELAACSLTNPAVQFGVISDHSPQALAQGQPLASVVRVYSTCYLVRALTSRDTLDEGLVEALIGLGEGTLSGFSR